MKESIGGTASLNIALAFIAIVFAFLAAALSYYKAFKVNNIITNAIEKYEGYNKLSVDEINSQLDSIGYERYDFKCDSTSKDGFVLVDSVLERNLVSGICVYKKENTDNYQYRVTSFMTINLPIVSNFLKIPINTVTNEIYRCYGNNCN